MTDRGRPLKFESPEELQEKIDSYFKERIDADGNVIKPISITGLALHLDTTRELLCNYEARDNFSDTVKKAKMRVEQYYEERLPLSNATGPIFALKNFGWTDRQETALTGDLTITRIERHIVDPENRDP